MRPLNRPMFRYGGPIKEGIMNGMKEKQAINTVGSPLAPKDESGRGGYAVPLIAGIGMGLARMAPYAARGISALRNLYSRQVPAAFSRVQPKTTGGGYMEYGGVLPSTTRLVPGGTGPVKGVGMTRELRPYVQNDPVLRTLFGAGKVGAKAAGPVKSALKYSFTTPSGLALTGYGAYSALKGEKTPEIQQQIEQEGGPPGGGDPNMFARPKEQNVDEDTLNKMNKDRIQQTKERYYKLMGLDKASKDTIANSLIKASQIVQEEGADLKGSLKSGTLQNKIIQAIAGEADKDKALKRQIDAAILKGEIEKDIKASDPNEQLAAEYRKKQIALADKSLSGDTLKDTINAAYSRTGVFPTGSSLAGLARVSGIDITSTADSVEVNKWLNDNKGKNEIDYLEEAVSKGTPDGNYVVNSRVLIVKDGKVIPYI